MTNLIELKNSEQVEVVPLHLVLCFGSVVTTTEEETDETEELDEYCVEFTGTFENSGNSTDKLLTTYKYVGLDDNDRHYYKNTNLLYNRYLYRLNSFTVLHLLLL